MEHRDDTKFIKEYKQQWSATIKQSDNGSYYTHFGATKKMAHLWGDKPEDIRGIELVVCGNQEVKEDKVSEYPDYWAWYDNERERFTLAWPTRFQLNMCFPYGMKAEEEAGKGKAYRVNIKEL